MRAASGVSRELGREAARLVFAYHRWRGWLNLAVPWHVQMRKTRDLVERFQREPGSFGNDELRRAVPGWLFEFLPAVPSAWLRSLQAEPTLWLRARPGTAEALARDLGEANRPVEVAPDALCYRGTEDLFRTPSFQKGRFELQDLASQMVSLVAAPQPGETWWDACAGEGGKTLHLADLMGNRGTVWATDRAGWRLQRLRLRAARAGLFNVRWSEWEAARRPPGRHRFDGVLVDAPCSGVGTWQRNPHARWTLTSRDVRELAGRQLALLKAASEGVKPGGRLVYAVCTCTKAETVEIAAAFEAQAAGFEPAELPDVYRRGAGAVGPERPKHHLWLWPQDWGANGMFVACWRRVGPA